MDLPIYETLDDFKEYYLDALAEYPELKGNKLSLLRQYQKIYRKERETANEFYLIPNAVLFDGTTTTAILSDVFIISLKNELLADGYITENYIDFDSPIVDEFIKDHKLMNENYYRFVQNPHSYDNHSKTEKYNDAKIEAIEEIENFIDEEIEIIKRGFHYFQQPQQQVQEENPENDFSDNADKVKVILLEQLGIIEKIKSLQTNPDTVKHTAEILSAITGIKSGTLFSYLRPMLQPYRDDNDKNSPYKNPDNQLKANKIIQKLKIKDVGN